MLMWGMLKMMNSMQFDMGDSKQTQKIKTDLSFPLFFAFALSSSVALRSYLAPVLKKKNRQREREIEKER